MGKYYPCFSLVGDQLLTAERHRRQAQRQWRTTGLTIHKELYNKAKHHFTKLVQKAKSLFYSKKIAPAGSSKGFYAITNKLAARTKCSLLPIIFPQSDLRNIFSDFFLNKIIKTRDEFGPRSSLPSLGKRFTGNPLTCFDPVSENTVGKSV